MGLRAAWNALFAAGVPPAAQAVARTEQQTPTLAELNAPSIAWAEVSAALSDAKYNPDDLIGRKGFDIYKRMINDEQVKAVMYFKRATVTGRAWFFELDHKKFKLSEAEAKRRVEVFTAMFDDGNYRGTFGDGLNAIMKSQWQGFSMTEQIFGQFVCQGRTYWGLRELKPKPFETFYPKVNDKGDVIQWVQRGWGANQRELKINLAKFVYYKHNADVDEHYGGSDLRAAYRAFLSKDIAIRFRNIFMERLAGGFVVMKPQEGHTIVRDSAEWVALTNILKNINGKSSVILPGGVDLEVVHPSGGQVGVFRESIEMDDHAIARAALVPNLIGMTPSGQTGSYSQSDTQFDSFMVVSDTEAQRLQDALNEQVFAPLGRVNFPDGVAPKFRFKELTGRQVARVLDMWIKLLSSGGAQASETDEEHFRKMLEVPDKGELLEESVPEAPAAISSSSSTPPPKDDDEKQRPAPPGRGEDSDKDRDKKRMRRLLMRAERRVAFTVIERQTTTEQGKLRDQLEDAIAEMVAEGVTRIELGGVGGRDSDEEIGKFDFDGNRIRAVERCVSRVLRAGMEIGSAHAKREVESARGKGFSRRLDMRRLGDMASDWMRQKSFTIAGDLKAGVVKQVKSSLVRGLKQSWSHNEIKKDIYRGLVSNGTLGGRTAAEALGAGDTAALAELLSLRGGLEPHRLDTVIRTNMFEAVNEARLNTFTDPEMGDFVVGLEYSAILDSRTTAVCEHMDGRAYTAEQWQGELRPWVPPNHFNCRSILIPITQIDEDPELEDELPRIEPQEGFD